VFYKSNHGSNFKLLKPMSLTDIRITKAREITKVRNVLGSLRDVLYAAIRDGYAVLKRFLLDRRRSKLAIMTERRKESL
jgi:hypothetical protein